MKKVININFQGRIIPIEEPAYDILKQYIESLRRYFSGEEGRDEIINDIESRIAELFSARLDAGAPCIVDEDVLSIISTIGRPEDFEQENGTEQTAAQPGTNPYNAPDTARAKFYRNADDKILGGVCSGLANYLKTDPVLIRILFVFLIAPLFWLYILLWLIVPSKSLQTNITRRFYRKAEGKVFGGVCGGLAVYFNTEIWIPRLIFALPLISALLYGTWDSIFGSWDFDGGWNLITGSLGSSLFLIYLILWIAVPMARSASDRLEMKGEKIDLESIRNTVKDNLGQLQSKAEHFGAEIRESAGKISRENNSGIRQFLQFVIKAIVFFVAGMAALVLLGIFIALAFGGMAVFPLKSLLLEGTAQNTLAWCTLILVLGIPVIAIITWLIRRISGVRSGRSHLPAAFSLLWIAGIVCACFLFASVYQNFKVKHSEVIQVNITQPASDSLIITAQAPGGQLEKYARRFWNDLDEDDEWLAGIYQDSFLLKNVKVHVDKSPDSQYHIYAVKYSRGASLAIAKEQVSRMRFDIRQDSNRITLPAGLMIGKKDKFRNQQVMVVVEVPEGKRISFDKSLDNYSWISFRNKGQNFDVRYDEHEYRNFNTAYTMTPAGLRSDKTSGSSAENASGPGERSLEYFSAVELDLPVQVVLHHSDRNYVVVNASHHIADRIRTSVHNNVLDISSKADRLNINEHVSIDVYTSRYEAIELNGSGNISSSGSLHLGEKLQIALNGSGNIELQGEPCRLQKIDLSGSGNINLQQAEAAEAEVALSGSGEIMLHVRNKIKGYISGSGNIINAGKARSDMETTGSGKFIQR